MAIHKISDLDISVDIPIAAKPSSKGLQNRPAELTRLTQNLTCVRLEMEQASFPRSHSAQKRTHRSTQRPNQKSKKKRRSLFRTILLLAGISWEVSWMVGFTLLILTCALNQLGNHLGFVEPLKKASFLLLARPDANSHTALTRTPAPK